MIVDLHPEAVVWLPDERDFVFALAESRGGHAKFRLGDPALEMIEDVLVDLVGFGPEGFDPSIVTLNSRASDWHHDAASHERSVIAWIVHGRVEGGALRWQASEGWTEGEYLPKTGDVAVVDGRSCLHRIDEFVGAGASCKRLSVVLA